MDRKQWRAQIREDALEPELPIIDAHHHVWTGKPAIESYELYDSEWLFADKHGSGHNVIATYFIECHTAYKTEGPKALKVVGETEFADAIAQEAERRGGRIAGACATITPRANLLLGAAVGEVLDAHLAASSRVRGIRHMTHYLEELAAAPQGSKPDVMGLPAFRQGFAELAPRGLSFDAFVMQPQLPEVTALARDFPQTSIILDHCGTPLAIGRYQGRQAEAFADWKRGMAELATCPNVSVKLGGLNMGLAGVDALALPIPFTSLEVEAAQRDLILTCIDLFGPARCMFESNFPVDMKAISYEVIWNAFKRITKGFTPHDRHMLFAGTAAKVYRLEGIELAAV